MSIGIMLMGLMVGFLVGLTGVGGAALLTPVMVFMGISPSLAVGTDLIYNSVTKLFGTIQHYRQKSIRWDVVRTLMIGSIPGAIVAIIVLRLTESIVHNQEKFMKTSLGYILILAALATLYQTLIQRDQTSLQKFLKPATIQLITVGVGFILGFIVGLTSVGSGSLFAIAMMLLYKIAPSFLVGTDIAHAFFLVTTAGILHSGMGTVDYLLVLNLIIGSIPGVLIASKLAPVVPAKPLKILVTLLILISGIKLIT